MGAPSASGAAHQQRVTTIARPSVAEPEAINRPSRHQEIARTIRPA
jgi:hypothetical protein